MAVACRRGLFAPVELADHFLDQRAFLGDGIEGEAHFGEGEADAGEHHQ